MKPFFASLLLALGLLACNAVGAGSNPPAELLGSWFSGSGGLSEPYDPTSGHVGTPNGSGLLYLFRGDGSYTKAFQSYHSNGGCTNGFTAFESGSFSVSGDQLVTHPRSGHLRVSDSCAPSLDSDKPLSDLHDERFSWVTGSIGADTNRPGLQLTRSDGASSLFRWLGR